MTCSSLPPFPHLQVWKAAQEAAAATPATPLVADVYNTMLRLGLAPALKRVTEDGLLCLDLSLPDR
jgi:hypothetical protein